MKNKKLTIVMSLLAGLLIPMAGFVNLGFLIEPTSPPTMTQQILAYVQIVCGPAFFAIAYKAWKN